MSDRRSGGYLALVNTGILLLWISYPQRPFFRVRRVHRLETLVARVGVSTDRQQVDVSMSYPRYLKNNRTIIFFSLSFFFLNLTRYQKLYVFVFFLL